MHSVQTCIWQKYKTLLLEFRKECHSITIVCSGCCRPGERAEEKKRMWFLPSAASQVSHSVNPQLELSAALCANSASTQDRTREITRNTGLLIISARSEAVAKLTIESGRIGFVPSPRRRPLCFNYDCPESTPTQKRWALDAANFRIQGAGFERSGDSLFINLS